MNFENVLNNFANNENPTREQVAEAYYARDLSFKLSFPDQFEWSMKKLGYHPSTFNVRAKTLFRSKMKNAVEKFLENQSNENNVNLGEVYAQAVLDANLSISLRQNKWNKFKKFLDENDHHGFYLAMDSSELGFLGF